MTTTTFTAPLMLLWTQVKILRWLILVVALYISVDGVLLTTRHMDTSPFRYLSHLALLIITFISGPVLFGVEFLHGSTDYLRTRPVSARSVFTIKMIVITGVVFACSQCWVYEFSGHPVGEPVLVVSLYLVLAFWASTVTILIGEIVRGILAATLTSIIGGVLLFHFFGATIYPVQVEGFFSINPIMVKGETFTLHLLAITPLLFLGMASVAYTRITFQRFTPSITSIAVFTIFIGFSLFTAAMNKMDGSFSYQELTSSSSYHILHSRWKDNQLELVEASIHGKEYTVKIRNYTYDGSTFHESSAIEIPDRFIGPIYDVLWEDDKLLVSLNQKPSLHVYDLINRASPQSFLFHWSEKKHEKLRIVDPETLELRTLWVDDIESKLLSVDYTNGELKPLNLHPYEKRIFFDEITARDLPYLIRRGEDQRGASLSFDTYNNTVIDLPSAWYPIATRESRLAGMDSQNGKLLHLLNVDNPHNPVRSTVEIPIRIWLPISRVFNPYGTMGNCWSGASSLKFGEDYLTLVQLDLQIAAVWDIRSFQEPFFVGLVRLPEDLALGLFIDSHEKRMPFVNPIKRSDGALGYLTYSGKILWLEFPALMKEAKKS